MTNLGDQIKNARKAKGMTQDALAEMMHVSRQAVSHWETNRTMPDGETLLKLSKALEYSFETEAQTAETATEAPQDAGQPLSTARPSEKLAEGVSAPRRKKYYWIALAAVAVLCIGLLVPALLHRSSARERAYKSPTNGEIYTVERFQEEAANEAGKAYLRVDPTLTVNHSENYDFWLYDFAYHEMNGIAISVDRVEHVIFCRDKENVEQIYTAADMQAAGLSTDIPANGDWSFQGGLPVQDTVTGVATLLRGTDANGAALTFTAYIPLTAK